MGALHGVPAGGLNHLVSHMPSDLHERSQVQALIERGAQIVEVLGAEEFEEDHLPGAINLPLRRIDATSSDALDPSRPVLVYCWDSA